MVLEEHIERLQKDLELKEPLGTEGEGYSLLLDETRLTISEASSGFQLDANLGELPHDQQENFFSKMLRGNLFFQATGGSVLGLNDMGTHIMLRYYFPYKASYRDFKERLEDFINTIDFWKKEVENHKSNPLES
jgi:hypothetical protein